MLLQDDTTNSLCNEFEEYMSIHQCYKSSEEYQTVPMILHVANVGLKKIHLKSNGTQEQLLSAIMSSYPKFEKHLGLAFKEPGYWVAHILQPDRKTDLLHSYFKQSFKEDVIDQQQGMSSNIANDTVKLMISPCLVN